MRTYPESDDDREELTRLNAADWMIEALLLNPSYCWWGPYADYMWKRGRDEGPDDLGRNHDHGWESRVFVDTWASFGWELDEWNICANFYFEIDRDRMDCPVCCGTGTHPDAQWVTESFYGHSSPFKPQSEREMQAEALMARFSGSIRNTLHGYNTYPDSAILDKYGSAFRGFCEAMRAGGGWGDLPLDPAEEQALADAGRTKRSTIGHDAINRWILSKARCKRFGIPTACFGCGGHGDKFTEPAAHLSLILWMLHPRKGASRGTHVKQVEENDLPKAIAWLQEAHKQNTERFAGVLSQPNGEERA